MDDLLKEAIADAKAVRETALENAKIALEEAFTPRLQSMLSKKIQSEIEVEEGEHEDEIFRTALSIVHFGWKKEAIPVTNTKKSIIAKIFEILFN